jgi:hypothetical protein
LAGERPRRLREDVESRLTRAVDAWQLSDVRALSGGNVALVCTAVGDGRPVVLKLIPRGHGDDALLASEATTCARAPEAVSPDVEGDPGWAERLRRTARALSPD